MGDIDVVAGSNPIDYLERKSKTNEFSIWREVYVHLLRQCGIATVDKVGKAKAA